jgi:hypothetical protein
MMKMEYSVLKEEMKDDKCGWSLSLFISPLICL